MGTTDSRFSAVIEPKGWKFEAPESLPLLEAAALSGFVLPSSCRNGTCRTCMCRLVSGRVRYNIEWPGLSAEEKEEGFILPCAAYPESDVIIDVRQAVKAG
ncbi:MAG: Ferredoxin [Herminiimonas sp.]|nr:Ferredoxin [Herminiimonas sp.]